MTEQIDDLVEAFIEMAETFEYAVDAIHLTLSIIGALLFRKIIAGQTLRILVLPLLFSNNIEARCRSPTKFRLYFSQLK